MAKSERNFSRQLLTVLAPMCSPSKNSGDGSSVHQLGYLGEGVNLLDAGVLYETIQPTSLSNEVMLLLIV